MNWPSALLWGFAATVVMTTVMAGSQWLGLTRMSLPFMIGTVFSADRDRAKAIGFVVHLVNGWAFAFLYAAVFESLGRATWWIGATVGIVHAAFVLLVGMTILPGLHPRMASEVRGPTPTRELEPPGFLALHYGRRTPITVAVAHVLYGVILGAFYRLR